MNVLGRHILGTSKSPKLTFLTENYFTFYRKNRKCNPKISRYERRFDSQRAHYNSTVLSKWIHLHL